MAHGIIGDYFSGKRLPPTDRFDDLVRLLGASPAEQGALATARDRVEEKQRRVRSRRTGSTTPRELPRDVAMFTGRDDELTKLDLQLTRTDRAAMAVVSGAAGVGKTAFIVHWAHRVQARFPDGHLYLNLRGYAAGPPLRPIHALARFLRSLGVPAEQVPLQMDEAAALYRSVLAGRRMLVLMTLDVLAPGDARDLLTRLLGAERVHAEAAAVGELADVCGHLPLALRIAAANLTVHPGLTIASYADRLASGNRLALLQVHGDPQSSVRTAFDYSYAALSDDGRLAFRRLGMAPGPDLTATATAMLAGATPDRAAGVLDLLAAAHLVDEHSPGRYTLHDLLRRYAAERCAEEAAPDRQAALGRLYDYYLHTASAAADLLYPLTVRLPARCRPRCS